MTTDYSTLDEERFQELLRERMFTPLKAGEAFIRVRLKQFASVRRRGVRPVRIDRVALLDDLRRGMSMRKVAEKHDCSVSMVWRIANGER